MMKVHAAVRTAVPLPVNGSAWTPVQVLMDNAPISGLARENDGQLWAMVPAGIHTLILIGQTLDIDTIELPILLKPHATSVTAPDWEVKGILDNGSVAASIQLVRRKVEGALPTPQDTISVCPLFPG